MMGPWSGKRVLLVDDSPFVLELNQRVFEDIGLRVAGTAKNGSEALDKFAQLRPDVVSMDIIMPEMHGIDCYHRLLSKEPGLLLMFISCLSAPHIIGETILEIIPRELFVPKPASTENVVLALEILYGIKEPKSIQPPQHAPGHHHHHHPPPLPHLREESHRPEPPDITPPEEAS